MYPIKVIDEFIYNKNKDVAIKLISKTIFSGDNIYNVSKYPYFEVWLLQSSHCNLTISNTKYELYEGDVLVFSENDSKDIEVSDNNVVFLTLQIDSTSFSEILPYNSMLEKITFSKVIQDTSKTKFRQLTPQLK
jgi:hypothetical protein